MNRAAPLALSVTAILAVLLAVIVTRGWVDYLLLFLAFVLLAGSYLLRRHIRAGMYRRTRARARRTGA